MTGDTLLLRQVNPNWVQQGRVSSQIFRPTSKDEDHLSVYDGDMITAEEAWVHFTETLGYKSSGVLAVSQDECRGQGLPVMPDPAPFPEHAYIDFTGLGRGDIEKKAELLRGLAVSRGWQYQTENVW